MPTKYKAIVERKTLDWDLDDIERRVENLWPAIQTSLHLKYDDRERLMADMVWEVTKFVLECDALPVRTINMLLATAIKIRRHPQQFLDSSAKYDPEVNAMVLCAALALSTNSRFDILKFEAGLGKGPHPVDIERAASNVINFLARSGQSKKGRPDLKLQTEFAVALGRIFRAHGGRITRITFDGETGPFHVFLGLIEPIVRSFAKNAGFAVNITTMVEKAQTMLGNEVTDKSKFSAMPN